MGAYVGRIKDGDEITYNLYDHEEIYEDCTVQVWSNTFTGDNSVGWFENQWTKVTDALPKPYEQVLVWDGDAMYLDFFDGIGFLADVTDEPTITHWRPLPKPPEVEA